MCEKGKYGTIIYNIISDATFQPTMPTVVKRKKPWVAMIAAVLVLAVGLGGGGFFLGQYIDSVEEAAYERGYEKGYGVGASSEGGYESAYMEGYLAAAEEYGVLDSIKEESESSPKPNPAPAVVAGYAAGAMSNGSSEDNTVSAAQTENVQTYILNTNTRKFHNPSCESVGQIVEKNYQCVENTRENVIAQGYEPCQRCYP